MRRPYWDRPFRRGAGARGHMGPPLNSACLGGTEGKPQPPAAGMNFLALRSLHSRLPASTRFSEAAITLHAS